MAPALLDRLLGRTVPSEQAAHRHSLVAAARRITTPTGTSTAPARRAASWQESAFDLYDRLGEIHAAFTHYGNGLSKARLYPAWRARPQDRPVPIDEIPDDYDGPRPSDALVRRALAEWDRLESAEAGLANQGGTAGLVSEFGTHLALVGETILYGRTDADGQEIWEALSVSELVQRDGRWYVLREPGNSTTKGEPVADDSFLLRIWRPHPRWSNLADSSVRPILDEGELLLTLQAGDLAISKSRVGNAGILYVDGSMDFARPDADGSDEPYDSAFIDELVAEAVAPLRDPSSAASVVPLVITGEGPLDGRIVHIPLPREMDEQNQKRAEAAIRRLAMGIDLPPELILGKADLNHWTAWQVDDATFTAHLEPTLVLIAEALSVGFLRQMLVDGGFRPDEIRNLTVGYDATDLVVRPDRGDAAVKAYDRYELSGASLLRELGFDEEDAPDNEEVERRLLIRAAIVIAQGSGQVPDLDNPTAPLPVPEDGETPQVGDGSDVPIPEAEEETDAAVAMARRILAEVNGIQTPGVRLDAAREILRRTAPIALTAGADADRLTALGEQLADLDRSLMERLEGAADVALRRVLERAGAQLRSRTRSDRDLREALRHVDNTEVAAHLGSRLVQTLGLTDDELVADGLEPLGERFHRWTAQTQEAALALVAGAVDGFTDETRASIAVEEEEDRSDAWVWLLAALTTTATGLLYDPSPSAPPEGEFDPDVRVPFGQIREAVARAGGAGRVAAGRGAGDVAFQLAGRGAAASARLLGALDRLGVVESGLRWWYTPIPRATFQPHLSLDGQTFTGPDDPGLTNYRSWPPVASYHPGDHRGCRCVWVPVLTRPGVAD